MDEVIQSLKSAAISQSFGIELPDEDLLVEIEEELLLPIPADFKLFLMSVSNLVLGSVEPVTVSDPQAHTHLPEVTAEAWANGLPRDLLVLATFADRLHCINSEGEVVCWHSGFIDADEQWESIWDWSLDVWLNS